MTAARPLDIDMGNTRTKWRCGDAAGFAPAGQLPEPPSAPTRVRVATVLRNQDAVAGAVRERFGVAAEFATVAARLGGVRCAYAEPAQLGVDRWLALVAAWRRARAATVVIGVGTAATVDFVRADGRHAGGYIAPGLRLLREALRRRTAAVRPTAQAAASLVPGTDTDAAVSSGTWLMLVAFAQAAVAECAAVGSAQPEVFLTGGDAELLAGCLSAPVQCAPHLVLDGLAIALP